MSTVANLLVQPATELARMVRDGEVTSSELVETSLRRIDELNPELNAFVLVDEEGARATAEGIGAGDPRPFAGVPIAIKDETQVAGLRFSFGSEIFGDFVPDQDAYTVRRLREAGFVIVGKTNLPEFGILPVTEPRRFGPTRNPWDPERTPGGSSGGASCAVAAGMVPVAQGSDGGGSVRIPAACTGLVGLKPSRGRISRGPAMGDSFLVTDGVLTRTVAETAELLDVLAGYEPGDATWAPPPSAPFADAARREPGKLRIRYTAASPLDSEVDPVCLQAMHEAAELLESLGHEVSELESVPGWSGADLLAVFTKVFGTNIALGPIFGGLVSGREPSPELIEPLSWEHLKLAREMEGTGYPLAVIQLQALTRQLVALWAEHDVLLTPALGQRPVRIGEIDACSDNPLEDFRRSGEFTPFTAIFNVTGQPAISVPLFHGDDGLPLGVQLAGPPAGEELLLSLAAQLEEARPWAGRLAPPASA